MQNSSILSTSTIGKKDSLLNNQNKILNFIDKTGDDLGKNYKKFVIKQLNKTININEICVQLK